MDVEAELEDAKKHMGFLFLFRSSLGALGSSSSSSSSFW